MEESLKIVDRAIRRVPDFPKPGILFYDITGVFVEPAAFRCVIDRSTELYAGRKLDAIAAVESRGFLFAAPLAERLGLPLILIRKKGKLPGDVYRSSYTLEYGSAEVEAHKSDIRRGQRVLVIDDLIATGGTLGAAKDLLEQGGAQVAEFFGVIGLPDLKFREALAPLPVTTLIDYAGA